MYIFTHVSHLDTFTSSMTVWRWVRWKDEDERHSWLEFPSGHSDKEAASRSSSAAVFWDFYDANKTHFLTFSPQLHSEGVISMRDINAWMGTHILCVYAAGMWCHMRPYVWLLALLLSWQIGLWFLPVLPEPKQTHVLAGVLYWV